MSASLSATAVLALVLALVRAVPAVPLADLMAGGSITAGGMVLDEWRLISEDYSDPAFTVDPADVQVNTLSDAAVVFVSTASGAFDVSGDGVYAYLDYMFGFRVTAGPGLVINGSTLALTSGTVTSSGDNGVFVQELVGTDPTRVEVPGNTSLPDLAVEEVELSWLDPSGGRYEQGDAATFAPVPQIYVSKDILVWASDVNETASLSGVEQRFFQVAAIAEPATLLLVGVGLIGLWCAGRKAAVRA